MGDEVEKKKGGGEGKEKEKKEGRRKRKEREEKGWKFGEHLFLLAFLPGKL